MIYVYPLSMAGLVLQRNIRATFQTEGLQIHKYLAFLHRLQNILPFTSVSNLAERPICRDVAEGGNIFQMTHLRWRRYAKDVYCVIFVRRKRVQNRFEYSALGVSKLMICSCLMAITSYIDALFFCKEFSLLGTGQERRQLKFLLRKVSPFYWEKQ